MILKPNVISNHWSTLIRIKKLNLIIEAVMRVNTVQNESKYDSDSFLDDLSDFSKYTPSSTAFTIYWLSLIIFFKKL